MGGELTQEGRDATPRDAGEGYAAGALGAAGGRRGAEGAKEAEGLGSQPTANSATVPQLGHELEPLPIARATSTLQIVTSPLLRQPL